MRFCDLDARGEQLSADGWKKVASLFVTPGLPRRGQIKVIKDFVVSEPVLNKDRAQFYVEYVELGRIDRSKNRFSAVPSMKVRATFDVVRTSGREQPAEWRIAGPVPEPHLTIHAAIRYATGLRSTARDVASKQRFDKLVADLERLR